MKEDKEHTKYYNSYGTQVPSCTTVVKLLDKPELVGWANYMGFRRINTTKFLEKKALYGTCCHELAEQYLQGIVLKNTDFVDGIFEMNDRSEMLSKLEKFGNKLNEVGANILGMELEMHGQHFGGTLDLLVHIPSKNRLVLLDFKTSKNVYNSHLIQLGGYCILLKELYGLDVTDIGIVLLSRNPEDSDFINLIQRSDNSVNEKIFMKLLDIYWLLQEN